jgi:hypothetical protein
MIHPVVACGYMSAGRTVIHLNLFCRCAVYADCYVTSVIADSIETPMYSVIPYVFFAC